ncbi:MAG: GlcG/HbpS family heme-binding protein [Bacillota bacterium]
MRALIAMALAASCLAMADEPTHSIRQLTPETALKAAQAALAKCREGGAQVAVAVVDRDGLTQVQLRDRYAGPHTLELSVNKAWTAVSFKTNTSELEKLTRPGQPMSGLRNVARFVAIGGGVMVEAHGSLLGAIGVSGAPGGDADEACALAGLRAISESLEF